jgi:eukaryotic-like serine/threonine-protein kinase
VTKDVTAPDPGRRFGRYEVQHEIGEGAMGRVYRAFDPLLRRSVAVKTVKPESLTRDTAEEYLRRFRREAQAAGRLSHPNIVSIYDVSEDYFVMEFVEGISLQSLLAGRAPLPLAEAMRILAPVAEAIDYVHRFGIIHRDIKPANIMIQPDGRPKLMDFGVARLPASVATGSGPSFGSPAYMAPEQIAGDPLTPLTARADLFSFGVVAYEALTGRRPFHGESIPATVYQVVHEPAPPPRSLNEDLPPYHDEVFEHALAKQAGDRYPNALAFVTALQTEGLLLPEPLLTSFTFSIPAPLITQAPMALPPVAAEEMETRLLKRRADGSLEADDRAWRRRWLPWAVIAAAAFVVSVEILALARSGPARTDPTLASPLSSPAQRIETRPPGASVWIDGHPAGNAPLSIEDLRPGLHQVRVVRDGYAPAELSFEIPEGTSAPPLRFVMAPLHTPSVHNIEAHRGANRVVPARLEPAPANPAPTPTPKPVSAGDLVDLDDSVKPPRLVSGERAPYPKEAVRLRLQGTVSVEVVVDEKGVPREPRVLQSAGAVLDEAVIEAVYKFRYEPAAKGDVPVRVRQTYSQNFPP